MITKTPEAICKDFCKIENYKQAINDKENMWIMHHRKEIELNLTWKELDELGLYKHRPPEELIFIKASDHTKLHYRHKKSIDPSYNHMDKPYLNK